LTVEVQAGQLFKTLRQYMQVGDLVEHNVITQVTGSLGVLLKVPYQTNNGDYLVYFSSSKRPIIFCRPGTLKLVDKEKKIN